MWQATPLFPDILARQIEFLCEKMHPAVQGGRSILPGDQGAGAILVLEGEVKVMHQTELAVIDG